MHKVYLPPLGVLNTSQALSKGIAKANMIAVDNLTLISGGNIIAGVRTFDLGYYLWCARFDQAKVEAFVFLEGQKCRS